MIPCIPRDELLDALRKMMMIRRLEEACIIAAHEGKVPGHFHVYIGQEATGVAVASNLGKDDYVYSTHRNHGHLVARGADPGKVLAEIETKATGYAGGKAGTLHGCAPDLNFPLSSGIVAGVIPISTGTAWAQKLRGENAVTAVFFGEGALEEGAAFEAINIASLWKLPLLMICENNTAEVERKPGQGHYHAPNFAVPNITDYARTMGLTALTVDGIDLGAVWNAAAEARERAISGGGATFIEVATYTWPGGQWPTLATGITDIRHAWNGEIPEDFKHCENWFKRNDPIFSVTREFIAENIASQTEIEELDAEVRSEMGKVVEFVEASPFPSPNTARTAVWPN
ncbi:MAG: thiamine pyrophosphate-dependent enzyme [Rhodospirillaceae bacterium]|jgi:TPP-dependent pyruvate/acetoin dehydrogenase alpha subunit